MIRKIRRADKGYTLFEMAVVAIVAASLFVLGGKWILSLTNAANSGLLNREGTQIGYALDRLENDVRGREICLDGNTSRSLQVLEPTRLSFIVNESQDAVFEKVTWRLNAGNLERSVVSGTGCIFPEPAEGSWVTAVQGVEGVPVLFQSITDGQLLEGVNCSPESCEADAVKVNISSTVGKASTVRTIMVD